MNNTPSVWTPERKGWLRRMFDDGRTDAEVAVRMDLSVRAVAQQRVRQGLLHGDRLPTGTGGVASYKTSTLLSALRSRGYTVRVMKRPTP